MVILVFASTVMTVRDYFGRYASHPRLEADFYLPDWELGQYAAAQSADTSIFLTPTQEEMATIYFALGGTDRIRSFAGSDTLMVMGPSSKPTLYLVRPSQSHQLSVWQSQLPDLIVGSEQNNFIPVLLPGEARRPQPQMAQPHSWSDQIQLLGWSRDLQANSLTVTLFWQAGAAIDRNYTAFVHLLDANGELVAQLDRPPSGYPTSDWRPDEQIIDRYTIELPADLPAGTYHLQTGFYYLPTLEALGTAVSLGQITR